MRTLGIPVSMDFTPQWTSRSGNHYWNALILPEGKQWPFSGTQSKDTVEVYPKRNMNGKGKVYRKMLGGQADNMELLSSVSSTPTLFSSGKLMDVTGYYLDCTDVNIPVVLNQEKEDAYAYTCVFNNRDWVANAWGRLGKNDRVIFHLLEKGVVYLPAFFNNGQRLSPINYPFYLTPSGDAHFLVPESKRSLVLTRKHPVMDVKHRLLRMIGGKFQGANRNNFSEAVDLFEIKGCPSIFFQEINISCKKTFRYLRYLSPPGGFCNIAELEFYGEKRNKALHGEIIGTQVACVYAKNRTIECAMDGKTETFFESNEPTGTWVGVDLGKGQAQQVTSIRFLPPNDDNSIRPGDTYELVYWGGQGWVSIGKQVAADYQLIFHNAPQNALFLLHNHTRGKEERIFTYENEQQVWW